MQTTEQQENIRRTLKGVDNFVKTHSEAWRAAFDALVNQLAVEVQPGYRTLAGVYESSLAHPDFKDHSPIEQMPPLLAIPFLTAWAHLTTGSPLYISDNLMVHWAHHDNAVQSVLEVPLQIASIVSALFALRRGRDNVCSVGITVGISVNPVERVRRQAKKIGNPCNQIFWPRVADFGIPADCRAKVKCEDR